MTEADAALASAPARDGQPSGDQAGASTRDRILDVALDLFTDQGFDGTSMREIAERLHMSKPAIYYHFASKEEILVALHMRLHEFGKVALERLTGQTVTLQLWGSLLNEVLDQILAQRKIFLMHERNQAALEKLHRNDHDDQHDDIQQRFRQALNDPSLSVRDRVRMACSLGAVFGALLLSGDAFDTVSNTELGSLVREAVDDLVADRGA
ncbi:MAG TPA: helix-turn-helix domain-containing protein [Streptosporangiaceae bacterium]|nr:helix-turn-helix domain-containing protein [Streptosporangiaceae bacterium]